MATNQDYRLLLVTSLPESFDTITELARRYFANVEPLYWEMGNKQTRPQVYEQMEASNFNLIVSHFNGVIFKPHHLEQATFGAVNIHPSPPEHPGVWGLFCQPVIRRDIRTHHGMTLHEIDERIDHGPIYAVERWAVPESASIEWVFEDVEEKNRVFLESALDKLSKSADGTRCFTPLDETWDINNAHHTIKDIQSWFRDLDPAHPAHQERIFFNHPKGQMEPPWFTDIEPELP
jgi:methionyl-tRNA formyltransferase